MLNIDYFTPSKILFILSMAFILYLSRLKNSFWKEIWTVSISPVTLSIIPISW